MDQNQLKDNEANFGYKAGDQAGLARIGRLRLPPDDFRSSLERLLDLLIATNSVTAYRSHVYSGKTYLLQAGPLC